MLLEALHGKADDLDRWIGSRDCPPPSASLTIDATLAERTEVDFYALLGVDARATAADIKAAYHRMLLKHHPDKSRSVSGMDFAQLKQAYETLSSPSARRDYDSRTEATRKQRPAQVVSLDDFSENGDGVWRYPCRCGREYLIREGDLERGVHLVGCEGCSEVVWVGYELVEENDENEMG